MTSFSGGLSMTTIAADLVDPASAGFVTVYPFNATRPLAATVNYGGGDIRGNLSVVRLNQASAGAEFSVYSFAQTHLVADVVGYYTNPQATQLNCTNTGIISQSIGANEIQYFDNPSCPVGYTATTPYCYSGTAGVYSQGSGFINNSAGGPTYCAWQNTTGSAQTIYGGNVCCRVPGR